jgi:hypothetical protein
MEFNQPWLPVIPAGRSPTDLTKKELDAHLTAVQSEDQRRDPRRHRRPVRPAPQRRR